MKKRYKKAIDSFSQEDTYSMKEAVENVIKVCSAKFDESIDVSVRLGIDPKKSDQQVRGLVSLPNGLGREFKVLAIVKGEKEEEAKSAGADYVGAEEYINKIVKENWLDFDRIVTSPDMMKLLAKAARFLGPRGLMPNPKSGNVTTEIKAAVLSEKKGRLSFKVDKAGVIHAPIGKKSMGIDKLIDNLKIFISTLKSLKPSSLKGNFMRSIFLSPTMGPSVEININSLTKDLK